MPRVRRITYDADEGMTPREGDFLRTIALGRLWKIVGARQVRSAAHQNRWALDVSPANVDAAQVDVLEGRARLLPLVWYPRGRRPL